CACAKDHIIEISDVVSCKWIYVKSNSHGRGNTVLWKPKDPLKTVTIAFVTPPPSPFPNLNCQGVQTCPSGPLDSSIPGSGSKEYKYQASLCDNHGANCGPPIDPGIIIVP